MRLLIAIAVVITLSSCSLLPKRDITTQTVKIKVPVLYSEAPPLITRPDLAIHELPVGARDDYAQIARYYKITVIQLLNYVEQMEAVLDNYQLISDTLDKTGIMIDDGIEVEVE